MWKKTNGIDKVSARSAHFDDDMRYKDGYLHIVLPLGVFFKLIFAAALLAASNLSAALAEVSPATAPPAVFAPRIKPVAAASEALTVLTDLLGSNKA